MGILFIFVLFFIVYETFIQLTNVYKVNHSMIICFHKLLCVLIFLTINTIYLYVSYPVQATITLSSEREQRPLHICEPCYKFNFMRVKHFCLYFAD